jgi:hypothetical protein
MHGSKRRRQDSQRLLQSEPEVGVVEAIFIASAAGAPMQSMARVPAHGGRGLEGDRYCFGSGDYSPPPYPREGGRHSTLIEDAALAARVAFLHNDGAQHEVEMTFWMARHERLQPGR